MDKQAKKIHIQGLVQGVGFRPFVAEWATSHGLSGYVKNEGGMVTALLLGEGSATELFISKLSRLDGKGDILPGARVDKIDELPMDEDSTDDIIKECMDDILSLKGEPIANFTGITNTDLKLEYGTANITPLTQYDQNYTALVCSLQKWGQALYDLGRFEDSAKVLEFAVKTRSDITATYRLLVDLYKTKLGFNEEEIQRKLDGLVPIAKNLNSLSRQTILKLLQPQESE